MTLTVEQAAKFMEKTPRQIHHMIETGDIVPVVRFGKTVRISSIDLL